jgi:3-hydroxyisobutyrate dehydrogenase-like beta-hydroxyacid dehydrogenase
MQNVTVVGLGIIGSAWAKNLHSDGLTVRAWNRSKKDLPFYDGDLAHAVEGAEMIIIVVADPPAVQSILDVVVPRLKKGQLVVQSSTISAEWTHKFADQIEKTGAIFLEAPFTGSKLAAEGRKTVFYLGGTEKTIELARPVLSRLSQHILHVGATGSASTLKLAMNLNLAIMAEAMSESLTLTRQAGIADAVYYDALHMNVGRSGLSDLKEPKFIGNDYAPQFSLKHMDKDLRLALETAGTLELPVAKALKAFYDKGIKSGLGEDDFIGQIRALGSAAGAAK